jgi:hypothetical protein
MANVLVEFHAAMREEPVELDLPERAYEAPRVSFELPEDGEMAIGSNAR